MFKSARSSGCMNKTAVEAEAACRVAPRMKAAVDAPVPKTKTLAKAPGLA